MSKAKRNTKGLAAVLYRRAVEPEYEYPARFGADQRAEVVEVIDQRVRIRRPGLVEQVMPTARGRSAFARLPEASPAALTAIARAARAGDRKLAPAALSDGLVLPEDSFGRKLGDTLASGDRGLAERQVESVRLWLKQQAGQGGDGLGLIDGEDQSWVIVPAGWVK